MWHCQQIYSRSDFYHISRKKLDRMFNNILPELLTAIFEHLPYQSLKQALLVSRLVVIIIPNQNKSNSKSFLTKLPNYFWQEKEVSWGSSWIVEEVSPPHQGKHLRGQPALAEPGARHQKVQHPWMRSPWLGLLPPIRHCLPTILNTLAQQTPVPLWKLFMDLRLFSIQRDAQFIDYHLLLFDTILDQNCKLICKF